MTAFAEPVVAWRGATGDDAPLVVLLHGRGSNETDIIALADHLPIDLAYADTDNVIPRELLERTWTYLHGDAGGTTTGVRDPGGHGLGANVVDQLSRWLHNLATKEATS